MYGRKDPRNGLIMPVVMWRGLNVSMCPVVRDWSLLNGLVLNSGLTKVQLKSIKSTPMNNEHSTLENMWEDDCKSNITGCCEDSSMDMSECSSLLLEVCTTLITKLPLSVCFSVVYFQLYNSDSPIPKPPPTTTTSHSVELRCDQPLFSFIICFKVNHAACSAVNNVSPVRCHGNDPLNKS